MKSSTPKKMDLNMNINVNNNGKRFITQPGLDSPAGQFVHPFAMKLQKQGPFIFLVKVNRKNSMVKNTVNSV